MNGLQYWFDGDKADLPTLKTNFQTIFQKTDADGDNIVFEKIWGNVNLRGSLIPQRPLESIPQWKERAKTEFTIMVNSQDNNLYKFIKVK